MKKAFQSFSKRLSRRLLMVFVPTILIVAFLVITLATIGLVALTNAYFDSEVQAVNNLVVRMHKEGANANQIHERIRQADASINEFYPFGPDDVNETDFKDAWAYNIVFDSEGTYIYHPDGKRIGKASFFDDIRQTSDPLIKELAQGMSSGKKGHQRIKIDGMTSYIFYTKDKNVDWSNAIIMPIHGLQIPTYILALLLLAVIGIGLSIAYWVSRISIKRSTKPLQLLAKSADEVAKGNFQNPLPELRHNDEISQLRDSFGNMQQSLTQYIDQLKTTTAQKAAIESELNIARDIQMSVVPKVFPQRPDIDIYASMTPAKAVGGDLYDFFVRDNELVFCVGDVSGKGVPAALLMMMTKSLFRAYAAGESMPDRIVSQINRDLAENNESCMFVTLFLGILDLTSGLLRYCNAGHEAPVIINKETSQLPVNNALPVGSYDDTSYLTQSVVLEPGSTIFIYTDGLNEAMIADYSMFGEQRILDEADRAIQASQLSPKAFIDRMTQAVHAFVGDFEQSDDLTMMAIRRPSQ